ncbi:aminotransferase-like domain-containing protein [Paenibacillus xylaniclasticus]|uniref:aminotransferase-like domain-containing protein n=1 Tax=Paenibacillus xylaniclasticus TaxID=588083 RepID=UPI000FDA2D9B|nr:MULTISPECIES: PLP-dependent aminotransferase family protein [Paenibacillus]GFN31617.1 aminotransferase [Paenibacillus curdlanolyticus]
MQYRFAPQAVQASSYAASEKRWGHRNKIISFVDGVPSEIALPAKLIRHAEEQAAARRAGLSVLQARDTGGDMLYRETIAERMAGRGMRTEAERVLAIAGAQQAIDIAARALTVPGDTVMVETPTNPAALRTLAMNGLHIVPVGGDEFGIDLERADQLMSLYRPRMIYVMPSFGVPAGRAWSLERRHGLLGLARQHSVLIIEDDSYGEMGYDESAAARYPALYSLAGAEGGVLYVNSLTATVLPRLHLGWAAGDEELIEVMTDVIHSIGAVGGSLYEQRFMCELLRSPEWDVHIRNLATCYSRRMTRLTQLLAENGPADFVWAVPQGGSSLWLRLPDGLDGEALLRGAQRKAVVFEPGAVFYASHPQRNTARLSVASVSDDLLERGVKLLLEAIEEFTARN